VASHKKDGERQGITAGVNMRLYFKTSFNLHYSKKSSSSDISAVAANSVIIFSNSARFIFASLFPLAFFSACAFKKLSDAQPCRSQRMTQ
jgi:predicted TIM-barrel fold metal-dependent hydrolase